VKYLLLSIILAAMSVPAYAQTSITNMDDQPIADEPLPNPDPNIYGNNVGEWAWDAGPDIGCGQGGCDAGGNMSYSTQYTVDGQSLQMNLVDVDGYPGYQYGCTQPQYGCYSDAAFFNRLSLDTTYDWATYSTLDVQAMTDDVGIAASQALEFGIEHDVADPDYSGYTDKYVMFFQCDFKGSQQWRIWGSHIDPNTGDVVGGPWTTAYDATTNQPIACQSSTQFYPPNFNHYYFHFERLLTSDCYKCASFLDFTIVYGNNTQEYHQLGCDPTGSTCNSWGVPIVATSSWSPGVWTAIQLDGDASEDQYSGWADQWTVCLATSYCG
jgi:hypothetical protein